MKKYSQEDIMNYIENQIKEAHDELNERYVAKLGEERGQKAFNSFINVSELFRPNDWYSGYFLAQNNKKHVGSWFFEENLQNKYIENSRRKDNLTKDSVSEKVKKQIIKDVIKEMHKKEKLAKKEKTQDATL